MVRGWVRSVRVSKRVAFVVVNDGSCLHSLQLVLTPEQAKPFTLGCSIQATGRIQRIASPASSSPSSTSSSSSSSSNSASPPSLRQLELHPTECILLGASPPSYPIAKQQLTLEFLREQTHLRWRTNTLSSIARIRSAAFHAFHSFLASHAFLHIHTPIISPLDCEGGGEAFSVTAPSDQPPSSLFFQAPAFLSVSGQLYAEMLASALTRVYAFGPTFRAETSVTPRHLAEFWMLEPEVSFCGLDGVIDLSERMIKQVTREVVERCGEELEFLEGRAEEGAGLRSRLRGFIEGRWQRMRYGDAIEALQRSGRRFEFPVAWGEGLHSEHERWLAEEHCKGSAARMRVSPAPLHHPSDAELTRVVRAVSPVCVPVPCS